MNPAVGIIIRGGGLEPETRAWISQMTTPPGAAHKRAYNEMIRGLKACGYFQKCDAIYLLGCHDSQAGRLNVVNPGEAALTVGGTVTFTANQGFAGNGTNGVLTGPTNYSAFSKYTQNSAHIALWSRTSAVVTTLCMGYSTGAEVFIRPRNTGDVFGSRANSGTSISLGNNDGVGLFLVSRSASNLTTVHKNGGTSNTTDASVSTAPNASPVTICAANSAFSTSQIAFASVGSNVIPESAASYAVISAWRAAMDAL